MDPTKTFHSEAGRRAWAEVEAAARDDGAPYLSDQAVRLELDHLGGLYERALAERNVGAGALWRILGCPDGQVSVALAVTAEATVKALREHVEQLQRLLDAKRATAEARLKQIEVAEATVKSQAERIKRQRVTLSGLHRSYEQANAERIELRGLVDLLRRVHPLLGELDSDDLPEVSGLRAEVAAVITKDDERKAWLTEPFPGAEAPEPQLGVPSSRGDD